MAKRKQPGRHGGIGTPATEALDRAGPGYTVHLYDHDPSAASYGIEAADALGLEPELVFKTLLADVEGALVVAVVPVSTSLDLKALATAHGGKRAAMADPQKAERSSGYVVGGISPLGQRKALPTYVDASAEALEQIYVSAGRRGADLGLAPGDLVALTDGSYAPIAR